MSMIVMRNKANTGQVFVGPENPLPVESTNPVRVYPSPVTWDDHESLTAGSTADRLTAAKIKDHDTGFISVESQAIRFWISSLADPTATVGHVLEAGDTITLESPEELERFRYIRRDGTDATLRASYGVYGKL